MRFNPNKRRIASIKGLHGREENVSLLTNKTG